MAINWKRYSREEKQQALNDLLADPEIIPQQKPTPKLIPLFDIFEKARALVSSGDKMRGLSTGYSSLDRMTMGLGAGDIVVIYGYTSMGKSQLAQNIALNVARTNRAVLFIGLELTSVQNAARLIHMHDEPDEAAGWPILFPASPNIGYQDISAIIAESRKVGVELVVVDQLQDLIHSVQNVESEIKQIMDELKRAAITHEIPIIVISHVNRQGAQAGPPPLEVLKGSSSIEQKADIALAVYQHHDAEPGDELYRRMAVALRKNRQRGMKHKTTRLNVAANMRLEETIQDILPGVAQPLDLSD